MSTPSNKQSLSIEIENGNRQIDVTNFDLPDASDMDFANSNPDAFGAEQFIRSQAEHHHQTDSLNATTSAIIDQGVNMNSPGAQQVSNHRISATSDRSAGDPAQFGDIINDPTGMYGEALSKELGVGHSRSATVKETERLQARAEGEDLIEQLSHRGTSRQKSQHTGGGVVVDGLSGRRPRPSTSGYNGDEDRCRSTVPRQLQGSEGPYRVDGNLLGSQPINRRLFADKNGGSGNGSAPVSQEYGGLEMIGTSPTPQGAMDANASSPLEMAPPPAPRNSLIRRPSSGQGNGLTFLLRSSIADDEQAEDDSELFIPTKNPRGRASGRRGGKAPRDSVARAQVPVDRTPASLREGKRRFSTAVFGELEEDDSSPPGKTPRHSLTQIGPRKFGTRQPYNPDAFARFQEEQSQRAITPTPRHSQPRSQPQREDYDEEDEDLEESSEEPSPEPRAGQNSRAPMFNNFGRNLPLSRYSGKVENVNINQDPPMVPQSQVSDAALVKRNLKRGKKEVVCKRGYGANDPENIEIVNLRESEGKTFEQIAKILNDKRIAEGRAPTLSTTSVTSRYSRTAPLLFAAQGEVFIPLSKRGPRGEQRNNPAFKMTWTDELDLLLVEITKQVESEKWDRVAELFAKGTGKRITAKAAALRHTMI